MKPKKACAQCGMVKNHSIHLTDHDFVDPRPNEYNTEAYMKRARMEMEAGVLVAIASLCRDCSGVIPRIFDNRIALLGSGVRICECGNVVSREEDLAAHGTRPFNWSPRLLSRMD